MKLVIMGLKNSGKTSLIQHVFLGKEWEEIENLKPTEFLETRNYKYRNLLEIVSFDLGGQKQFIEEYYTESWSSKIFSRIDIFLFIIDSSNSLEFELAYAISQIDSTGEKGTGLLSHKLSSVREGAWMGLTKIGSVDLLQRLDLMRMKSSNPLFRHAAYRAIDGILIKIEANGGEKELMELEKFLPEVNDQEAVLTRVEWTITRLEDRQESIEQLNQ